MRKMGLSVAKLFYKVRGARGKRAESGKKTANSRVRRKNSEERKAKSKD